MSYSAMDTVFKAVLASMPDELVEALVQAELTSPSLLMAYLASSPAQLGWT